MNAGVTAINNPGGTCDNKSPIKADNCSMTVLTILQSARHTTATHRTIRCCVVTNVYRNVDFFSKAL